MPLKPFRVTANLPGEIKSLVDARVKEEHYPSVSSYLVGLVLFDIYSRRKHWLTGSLMREPQWVRDQVIVELVRDFEKAGNGNKGWFEMRIEELLKERREQEEGDSPK